MERGRGGGWGVEEKEEWEREVGEEGQEKEEAEGQWRCSDQHEWWALTDAEQLDDTLVLQMLHHQRLTQEVLPVLQRLIMELLQGHFNLMEEEINKINKQTKNTFNKNLTELKSPHMASHVRKTHTYKTASQNSRKWTSHESTYMKPEAFSSQSHLALPALVLCQSSLQHRTIFTLTNLRT